MKMKYEIHVIPKKIKGDRRAAHKKKKRKWISMSSEINYQTLLQEDDTALSTA